MRPVFDRLPGNDELTTQRLEAEAIAFLLGSPLRSSTWTTLPKAVGSVYTQTINKFNEVRALRRTTAKLCAKGGTA